MSTVKSKNLQIGTDGTASNNFTIYQPGTPDGTLRVGNGNAGSATEIAQFTANGIVMASGKSISGNPPQVTVLTSGTGTYTTPTNASYLVVEMVGGGGGGGGSGGGSGAGDGGHGTAGGNTTFAGMTANGGGLGYASNQASNLGGTVNLGSITTAFGAQGVRGGTNGFYNTASGVYTAGGMGAASALGFGYGGGGTGAGSGATSVVRGSGGSAGGYIKAWITSPSASYAYAVGAGGTGGTAGTNGVAGQNGGSGVIVITAYFG